MRSKLVILGCDRSAGEALRTLQDTGYCLPQGVQYRPLSCGGVLDTLHILRALEAGAERVLVLSCYKDACRSYHVDAWAAKRSETAQTLLQEAGLDSGWVLYRQISPNMAIDLGRWIAELLEPAAAGAEQAPDSAGTI